MGNVDNFLWGTQCPCSFQTKIEKLCVCKYSPHILSCNIQLMQSNIHLSQTQYNIGWILPKRYFQEVVETKIILFMFTFSHVWFQNFGSGLKSQNISRH